MTENICEEYLSEDEIEIQKTTKLGHPFSS